MIPRIPLGIVVPLLLAGSLGVLVMATHGASRAQIALQSVALLLGALCTIAIPAIGARRLLAAAPWVAAIAIALLVATFLGESYLGVHRWITLGPIRVHASSIAAPAILFSAAVWLSQGLPARAAILLALAQALHVLQPDAGQSTALAAGAITAIAFSSSVSPRIRVPLAMAMAAFAALSWTRPDPLPAVPLVEGIVQLAADLGRPVRALAIAALAAIPIAAAIATGSPSPSRRPIEGGLTAYLAAIVLVPLAGNFPVPVMGFGVSPLLGVALCLGVVGAIARAR